MLIAIIRKEFGLEASLYTCLKIVTVSLFEKTQISWALQHYLDPSTNLSSANQLMLPYF